MSQVDHSPRSPTPPRDFGGFYHPPRSPTPPRDFGGFYHPPRSPPPPRDFGGFEDTPEPMECDDLSPPEPMEFEITPQSPHQSPRSSTANLTSRLGGIFAVVTSLTSLVSPISPDQGNVSQQSVAIDLSVNQFLETSLEDIPLPCFIEDTDDEIPEYFYVYGGTQRGRDCVVDSNGYEYTFKEFTKSGLECWRCPVRNSKKGFHCLAQYLPNRFDKDGNPMDPRGPNGHRHKCEKKYKPEVVRKLRADLKAAGLAKLLTPGMDLVKVDMQKITEEEQKRLTTLPSMERLAAQINWSRRSVRPQQITSLFFYINQACIPEGFLQKDIQVGESRHIIFATMEQLKHLSNAVNWYVDGTFKIVKKPFAQMFSVHVFVRSGLCTAQIPVAFVLMSGRSAGDYESVFKALLELVPQNKVQRIILDFERAVWSALKGMMSKDEFPVVELQGCFFHFTQAVFRRIQNLGMKTQYARDEGTKDICRCMMSLPLLPCVCIRAAFEQLKQRCDDSGIECLRKFAEYMEKNWINGYFNPATWVQFKQLIRTNNHVEGYHRGLNSRVGGANVNTYSLIQELHNEAITARQRATEVEMGKFTVAQARPEKKRNEDLKTLWDKLAVHLTNPNQQGGMTPMRFLANASKGTNPVAQWDESRADLDEPAVVDDEDVL